MKIATRLLFLFALVAVLPMALFSYLNLQQGEATLRSEALDRVADIADKKAAQIKSYLSERIENVRLLARMERTGQALDVLSRAYLSHRSNSQEYARADAEFRSFFASYLEEGLVYDVFLITPQGEIVYTQMHEADFSTNLINGPYRDSQLAKAFRAASMTLEPTLSTYELYAPSHNDPAAFIVVPVMVEGRFKGMLAVQLNNDRLIRVATDATGMGVSGETVLAEPDGVDGARFTAPVKSDPQAAMQRKIAPKAAIGTPILFALGGDPGEGVKLDYRGKPVVAAWRYLPGLGWGMVVKIDADEVFAPIYQQRTVMLEMLFGLLLFAGLIAYYFGRQISTPLESLVRNAGEVANGDLSKRADESAPGELGLFARAFNRMTENLQELYHTLEDRIEERTRELNVSNEQLQEEIIERERTEAALRDNQEHLRAALEDLRHQKFALDQHAIVATTDVRGTITYVNEKFCEISGYSQPELFGKNHRILNSGTHPAEFFHDMYRTISAGKVWHGEICNRAKDGHLYWVMTTIVPYLDSQGNPTQYIAIRADITEQKQFEQALQQSAARIVMLLNSVVEGIYGVDMRGNCTFINSAGLHLLGYSEESELTGKHIHDLIHHTRPNGSHYPAAECRLYHCLQSHEDVHVNDELFWRKDGSSFAVDYWSRPTMQNGEEGAVVTFFDITERKQAEEAQRVAAATFETHEGIMITDVRGNILRVNRAFQEITGFSAEEVLGKNPRILSSGRQSSEFYEEMWRLLLEEGAWSGEIWDRRKNGEIYPKWLNITAVKDEQGTVTEYVAIFSDITARKRAEEEIRNLAFYDALTGLPNRRFLLDRFHLALSVSARSHHCGALLFLDMDKFKTLNDTQGHDYGDLMLIEVGRRMLTCVREVDTVARLGGDEFVVLIEEVSANIPETSQKVALIAEKVRAELAEPYVLKGHEFHSSPSIGVCLYRGNSESVDVLMKQADMAMYQAKDAGRNTVRFFDPLMQQAVEARAELEADLRGALPNGQLQLYYQIQVDSDHRPIGAEALIRWMHPQRGMVSPVQFIPVAEESGLILDIGHWVIETACQQLAEWARDEQMRHLALAINVSARQFQMDDFIERLEEMIVRHDIAPERLKLELTESVVLADVADVVSKMHALKALGVRLSLDDFGTGYSSLAYLKQLPLDQIKIDQSFVRDISTDPNDAVMVKTIIDMAQNFRLNVIAEGVETRAQLDFLKQNGCMAYQGYLFSKPVPLKDYEVLARHLFG